MAMDQLKLSRKVRFNIPTGMMAGGDSSPPIRPNAVKSTHSTQYINGMLVNREINTPNSSQLSSNESAWTFGMNKTTDDHVPKPETVPQITRSNSDVVRSSRPFVLPKILPPPLEKIDRHKSGLFNHVPEIKSPLHVVTPIQPFTIKTTNYDVTQFLTVPKIDINDAHDDDDVGASELPNEINCGVTKSDRKSSSNAENENETAIPDKNQFSQAFDFLERWRRQRKKQNNTSMGSAVVEQPVRSHICFRLDRENKRSLLIPPFRSYKMSLDKLPRVTKLLRAARDANQLLLKKCLQDIKSNGISKEDLNATDLNGRTAISYICSTYLSKILEEIMYLPEIDVNKPDNEGNTPLHFAAEAGMDEIVNLLLSRSRSIKCDIKNAHGITPLMKAAIQGRTKCAKLLLFAGASPTEIDYGRGFRPDQWARFCGRFSCAEMIEKQSRSRLLEKSTSCQWAHDSLEKQPVSRTKTNPSGLAKAPSRTDSLKQKLGRVLPFKLRDKNANKGSMECNHDLVTYLTAAALCASGPVLPTQGKVKFIKTILHPIEVPKVHVTPGSPTKHADSSNITQRRRLK